MDEIINKQKNLIATDNTEAAVCADCLLADIRSMIETTKNRLARSVNTELSNLYWGIGKRIRQDIIGQDRADYGEQIVLTLSRSLSMK